MKIISLLSSALFGLAATLSSQAADLPADAKPAKPNIVIIMADDLGWNAVGYHNAEVKTPHLDQFCKEGIELDQFYVSPMCSPTRAGTMTGRYPIRFGCARAVIPPWRDYGVPTDEVMLPQALAKAGYAQRGAFGKWHLGHAQKKWHPNSRGFTEFVGCYNGAIDYFTFERDGELDWHHNEKPIKPTGYATEVTGDAAVNFIEKAAQNEDPFFCYVAFNAPHSPFQAPENYLSKYKHIKNEKKRTYYAMITVMDDQIGRILASLEKSGEEKDTIVWFFSDNGGVGDIKKNNLPLKGSKLTTFDGGVRSVACVRYPKGYPSGKKTTEQMAFIDVLPTLLSAAGISPESLDCKPIDGLDLNPVLSGKAESLPTRDLYFYHGQSGEKTETIAINSAPWKLIMNGPSLAGDDSKNHKINLFKLGEDPEESKDLSQSQSEIVDELMKKLIAFRKLQPANAIPAYGVGKEGFTAPKDWKITD